MMPGGPSTPNSGKPGSIVPGFRPAYQAPALPFHTIANPIVPPPIQLTTGVPFGLAGHAALPNQGLPGQVLPGFSSGPELIQMLPADPPTVNPFPGDAALPNAGLAGNVLPGFHEDIYVHQPRRVVIPNPPVTIFGALDGVNRIFTWQVSIRRAVVFRNGVMQTLNVDVCVGATAMTFLPRSIPIAGDILTVTGWM